MDPIVLGFGGFLTFLVIWQLIARKKQPELPRLQIQSVFFKIKDICCNALGLNNSKAIDSSSDSKHEFDTDEFSLKDAELMYNLSLAIYEKQNIRSENIDKKLINLIQIMTIWGGILAWSGTSFISNIQNIKLFFNFLILLFICDAVFAVIVIYCFYRVLKLREMKALNLTIDLFKNDSKMPCDDMTKAIYIEYAYHINDATTSNENKVIKDKIYWLLLFYKCFGCFLIASVLIFIIIVINLLSK